MGDELENGAIQPDASKTGEQEERPLSAREQMMEKLASDREEQLIAQIGVGEVQEESKIPATAGDPDTSQKVKVKIDGEEKELPLSEVVKGFQKDATASQRLEVAAREKQEAEIMKAANLKKEQELAEREAQISKQTATGGDGADDEDAAIDAALDAYVEGDKDQLKAILKKGRPDTATPMSEQDIDKIVEQRLAKKQLETDEQTANAQFANDYPQLLADRDLRTAANNRYFAKIAAGMPVGKAMLEAGKETKEWLESFIPKTMTARDEKLLRKSTINNIPNVGARSGSLLNQDMKPENPSDVIKEMRRSRGLPV